MNVVTVIGIYTHNSVTSERLVGGGIRDWNQGFAHGEQMYCHWNASPLKNYCEIDLKLVIFLPHFLCIWDYTGVSLLKDKIVFFLRANCDMKGLVNIPRLCYWSVTEEDQYLNLPNLLAQIKITFTWFYIVTLKIHSLLLFFSVFLWLSDPSIIWHYMWSNCISVFQKLYSP